MDRLFHSIQRASVCPCPTCLQFGSTNPDHPSLTHKTQKAGLNNNNANCAKTYCECGACSSSQADGNLWGPGALEVVNQCLKDGHIVGIASFNNLKNVLNFFKLAAPELLKK